MVAVLKDFGLTSLDMTENDFLQRGWVAQIGYPPLRIDILNEIDGVSFEDARANHSEVNIDGIIIKYNWP